MQDKFKTIIKNPLTGISITAIIAVGILFISRKEIEPRFYVSEPELIADITAGTPKLKLLWEDEEIENVYSINIYIWNAGKEFIDNQRILDTNPIRVTYPSDIQILSPLFTKFSREDLKISAEEISDAGEKYIRIDILGDEALEYKDGGMLHILFSGYSTEDFQVTGRIKGNKEGFRKVEKFSNSDIKSLQIMIILYGVTLLIILITFIFSSEEVRIEPESKRRLRFVILIAILNIIFIILGVNLPSLRLPSFDF